MVCFIRLKNGNEIFENFFEGLVKTLYLNILRGNILD